MFSYLPWLLILACPLMMLWMMRGMGSSTKKDAPTNNFAGTARGDQVRATGVDAGDSAARIAELEREVAELRGGRVQLNKSPQQVREPVMTARARHDRRAST